MMYNRAKHHKDRTHYAVASTPTRAVYMPLTQILG